MKKGVPDCGQQHEIALGFEKLVSIFSILCGGFVVASLSCVCEVVLGCGAADREERERASAAATVVAGLHAAVDDTMRQLDQKKRAALAKELEMILWTVVQTLL